MAKEETAPAEAEAGGSKKKLIIIIGAAVGVAIILGIVAFMMLGKGDKKAKKEGEAAPAASSATAAGTPAAAGAPAPSGPSPNIFALEPFIVNIYDGQELRYLKVKVELEMVSPAIKGEIESKLAPVRDAVLVLLSAKTLQDIQDVQGKNTLKDEILAAVSKHLAPGKIAKVYFTDFVVQ